MVREIDLRLRKRDKVIRVWNGCTVIAVLQVSENGNTTQFTAKEAVVYYTCQCECHEECGR